MSRRGLTSAGYKARPTRYEGLSYRQDGPGVWRVVDTSDGREASVGPQYRTKLELLADLDRYATEYGAGLRQAKERFPKAQEPTNEPTKQPARVSLSASGADLERIADLLHEVSEFLDGQADITDGDEDGPRPNRAMQLKHEIDVLLGRVVEGF